LYNILNELKFLRHLSGDAVLVLLLKIIRRKTIIFSNENFEFFEFVYAASFYDIQINLKTPKHSVPTFILAKMV
jgi:hypothetical protein